MLLTTHIVIINFENAIGIKRKKKTCVYSIGKIIWIYELNIYDYINWIYELNIYLIVTLSV